MAGSSNQEHDTCLVLDYGSQYTQLIARRIREKGVYSMLLPGDVEMVIEQRERAHLVDCFDGGGRDAAPPPLFPLRSIYAACSRFLSSSAM